MLKSIQSEPLFLFHAVDFGSGQPTQNELQQVLDVFPWSEFQFASLILYQKRYFCSRFDNNFYIYEQRATLSNKLVVNMCTMFIFHCMWPFNSVQNEHDKTASFWQNFILTLLGWQLSNNRDLSMFSSHLFLHTVKGSGVFNKRRHLFYYLFIHAC